MPPKKELDPTYRARICELYTTCHWGTKRIHTAYPEIPLSTLKYTIRVEHQRRNNASLPCSGQPRKLTEEDRDHLYNVISTNSHIKYQDLMDEVDNKVQKESIRNLLNEMGLKWCQLSWLALCHTHAAKRLEWARKYEHFTSEDWARVCWSDECSIECGVGARATWIFIQPSEQLKIHDIHEKPHGKGVKKMFGAGFGEARRTGLVPLDSNPEAPHGGVDRFVIEALYHAFLPEFVRPGDIFMQDNSPLHWAYLIQGLLEDLGIEVMDWPPYSPDLNPIENLWALMKTKIYELYPELKCDLNTMETLEQLIKAAKEAWQALDREILVKLSDTMPNRVKAVIEADGWYTKY